MKAGIFASCCLILNSNNYGNMLPKHHSYGFSGPREKKSENGVGDLDNEERKFRRAHKL